MEGDLAEGKDFGGSRVGMYFFFLHDGHFTHFSDLNLHVHQILT